MEPLDAPTRLRKLATGRNKHGGLILPYSDDILAVLDALGEAQREIAELQAERKSWSDLVHVRVKELTAAEARCAELTKERDEFQRQARENGSAYMVAADAVNDANATVAEQAGRIETLTEALGDLVSDAERQMANPSHHMPFSLPKARAALAGLPGKGFDEQPCLWSPVSSRMCERGNKGCDVHHGDAPEAI